jgi:hypothetical protein
VAQVPLNASDRTTRVWGGTKDHHSALLGGHSTLNTVVLGEGVSKSKYIHPLLSLAYHSSYVPSCSWHQVYTAGAGTRRGGDGTVARVRAGRAMRTTRSLAGGAPRRCPC